MAKRPRSFSSCISIAFSLKTQGWPLGGVMLQMPRDNVKNSDTYVRQLTIWHDPYFLLIHSFFFRFSWHGSMEQASPDETARGRSKYLAVFSSGLRVIFYIRTVADWSISTSCASVLTTLDAPLDPCTSFWILCSSVIVSSRHAYFSVLDMSLSSPNAVGPNNWTRCCLLVACVLQWED